MEDEKTPTELKRVTAEKGREEAEEARNTLRQLTPTKPGDVQ
jgi:hypothetical protein